MNPKSPKRRCSEQSATLGSRWLRTTFRDWVGESTNFTRELAEAALAHRIKDKAEAAYSRGDAIDKRRVLMQAWADYCSQTPARKDNVVEMHRAFGEG